MKPPRAWATSVFVGMAVGVVVALWMMYAAWQHNPGGEFRSPGQTAAPTWFLLGLAWFLASCTLVALAVRALIHLWRTIERRNV